MPGPDADLDLLTRAAREAGEIAMHYFRADPKVWEKAGDAGPVTEADYAVDRHLRETLRAARPDYGWLSEETEDGAERLSHRRVFVVDPIDGTRAFVKGETAFAHSLAVVEDGVPVAGVVYLPAKDRLYAAAQGQGATLNGAPIGVAAETTDLPRMLTTRPNVEPVYWPGGVPEMQRHFRPSLAYRMALVAEGRFDGMLTFRDSWEWDIAAGVLLCAEAGATVTEARGTPLRFNSERGMVAGVLAAAPGVHAGLLARM